jgi:glycosyltransferase involved in cell wall biosynthesis
MLDPAPLTPSTARLAARVLFDAHQLGRHQTGNETYVRELLAALRQRDEISIVAAVESAGEGDRAVAGLQRRRVPRNGWLRLAAMSLAAGRDRVDVIHAIYFAPVFTGRPLVLTVHDVAYEIHPEFFSRSEVWRNRVIVRNSARRARFVVTVSETSRLALVERYGLDPERVVAIHNGVGPSFFATPARTFEPIGDRPIRVLAVGTLQPRKNLGRLLLAIRAVAAVRPVTLTVVGPDGFQADAIRAQLDGVGHVHVLGYLTDGALLEQYLQADMMVYPSIYEGFGLPVVEAMATGLPVITTTGGALPEVAGEAASIVDPLDVGAIASEILRLADDVDLRRTRAATGRVRAASFSWSKAADQLVSVYRAAIDG